MLSNVQSGPSAHSATNLHGWLLVSTCWLASAGAVLIAPVLPFMQQAFADQPHAEVLTLIVLVIPGLMIALLGPLMGAVVDVVGRKRLYMLSIAVYAVAGAMPFFLHDLYAILATRVVVGIAEAAITTISTALTADYFQGKEREKWLTIQLGSASIVAVAMFALGGVLGGFSAGWRTPFLVYGCAVFFLPLIAAFVWEPQERVEAPGREVQALPFPWRQIGHICAMSLFTAVMYFVITIQISFLLTARGVTTPAVIGIGSAIANAGVPFGAFVFHRLSGWAINRLIVLSFAIIAAGFYIVSTVADTNVLIAGAFVACFGGGIVMPLMLNWIMVRLPFAQRGRGAGGYMAAFFLGNFLSPLVVAALAAEAGSLFASIGWLSAICAVVSLGFALLTLLKRGPTEAVGTHAQIPLPH
ncbi:MFS transporter [Variovorax sp. Sphag1AA]|uniref:MFS transporter n=1 Tax=Variovorax sp. Sphag1AA TaxID=2587027 RepID=UPI00161AE534|nr:MFS transporter [Variovorax sp. Sphag1AA]MBB3181674.1 MFS family permease [Variovorax sp. Sphag1AA]